MSLLLADAGVRVILAAALVALLMLFAGLGRDAHRRGLDRLEAARLRGEL